MNINEYIKKIESYYLNGIVYTKSIYTSDNFSSIPIQLEEFYKNYGEMQFPFGRIYSIEKAIEMSKRAPFEYGEWFCFGQDNFFSFWLCKKGMKKNEMVFSIWDHECGDDIEEACFGELCEFLEYLSDEYDNSEEDRCDVIVESCDSQGLKELMTLKKIFSSSLSISEMKSQVSNGECIIRKNVNWYDANRKLFDYNFEHIVVTIKNIK